MTCELILIQPMFVDERFEDGDDLLLLRARSRDAASNNFFILPVGPAPRFLVPLVPNLIGTRPSTDEINDFRDNSGRRCYSSVLPVTNRIFGDPEQYSYVLLT